MYEGSLWAGTISFFPLFLQQIADRHPGGHVCVVGAADGKFVLPLLAAGLEVTAVEVDPVAIGGGPVELPDGRLVHSRGLREALAVSSAPSSQATVLQGDFGELAPTLDQGCFQAVFTSCSWHYSRNRGHGIAEFVAAMSRLLCVGGLFCAEYMMPIAPEHASRGHYLERGQLRALLEAEHQVLMEWFTEIYGEAPHVGNPVDHEHRMGAMLARKQTPVRVVGSDISLGATEAARGGRE